MSVPYRKQKNHFYINLFRGDQKQIDTSLRHVIKKERDKIRILNIINSIQFCDLILSRNLCDIRYLLVAMFLNFAWRKERSRLDFFIQLAHRTITLALPLTSSDILNSDPSLPTSSTIYTQSIFHTLILSILFNWFSTDSNRFSIDFILRHPSKYWEIQYMRQNILSELSKLFKGCLPQNLLSPFLNTLPCMIQVP